MRQPARKKRPRTAQLASFPSPTAGWISNRNLAIAKDGKAPPGATLIENFFPTATGITLRRGNVRYASVDDGEPIRSMFTYVVGGQEEMFAATDGSIWDITTISDPDMFGDATEVVTGKTDGDWSVVQFATPGGTFLIGVNGTDEGVLYDGTDWWPYITGGIVSLAYTSGSGPFTVGETVTGGTSGSTGTVWGDTGSVLYLRDISADFTPAETITGGTSTETATAGAQGVAAPGPAGVAVEDLSYVWVYKERVWFIENNSLSAWYLEVSSIGGDATELPLGGVFVRGGSLLWGHSWSLYNSDSGNLSEQVVFCTTEGEIAAYQGYSPEPDQGWGKVGTYRIGSPMGKKGFIRAGGDLIVATTVGFISLSQASSNDYAALGRLAISYPIEDEWSDAITERGATDWRCHVWAEGQMVLVAPPNPLGAVPSIFVTNSNTGAWAPFTGWDIASMVSFQGNLYFGSSDGVVRRGWVSGSDDGAQYVGTVLPLFEDLGAPASLKVAHQARAVMRGTSGIVERLSARFDFDETLVPAPSQPSLDTSSLWGVGLWGEAIWGDGGVPEFQGTWRSVGGSGHDVSLMMRVTSGELTPIDVELIRFDLTFSLADVAT